MTVSLDPLRPRPQARLDRQGGGRRRRLRRARPRGLGARRPEGAAPARPSPSRSPPIREKRHPGRRLRPGQPAGHPADRRRPRGRRRPRADRDLRAEDQRGDRRAPLRRPAGPLRGAQRGPRAGVHRAGRDDRGHPERPRDRAGLAAGRRDDRPHRRARRHRPRGRLPVDAGGGGDPLPAQPDPAGLSRGRHPPADRAVGAAGRPGRAQGLRREGPPTRASAA